MLSSSLYSLFYTLLNRCLLPLLRVVYGLLYSPYWWGSCIYTHTKDQWKMKLFATTHVSFSLCSYSNRIKLQPTFPILKPDRWSTDLQVYNEKQGCQRIVIYSIQKIVQSVRTLQSHAAPARAVWEDRSESGLDSNACQARQPHMICVDV